MFTKVLIANRGAIACRIARTLRRLNVRSVAVYAEADAPSRHVTECDEAVAIGPSAPAESYLSIDRIIAAARETGAGAIHPGYGFLAENPEFAERCEAEGIVFIGPTPGQMRAFGLKHSARALAEANDVPLLPGTGLLPDVATAKREASRIGYPVMLKSTAGGGGIGMQLIRRATDLPAAFASVERLARNNFREGGIYLEKFVQHARHIEVQIFGDGAGEVVALGERDCSAQRRNQKVLEETPAPGIGDDQRARLFECAVRLGRAVAYRNAGTVEFVLDADSGEFYFLEVNTRLQVEHGVTEAVTGIDLVEWMVRQAAGELGPLAEQVPAPRGASIQARLYSEDPGRGFQPSVGVLTEVLFPNWARVETWVERGTEISPFYDPLLAKLIVSGSDRREALERLGAALAETRIHGLESNLAYLREVVAGSEFQSGRITTATLGAMVYAPATLEVIEGGTLTTVQDFPGRLGYWDVGVPPSGPMDSRTFRLVNRLVGNPSTAAGLECTLVGPTLRFRTEAWIALGGAQLTATLDGRAVPYHRSVRVRAGQTLRIGAAEGPGMRAYLAIRGGLDVPDYLGSRSTFTLGGFGGHAGRALRAGDVLRLNAAPAATPVTRRLPSSLVPALGRDWDIGVTYGPHGAPEFFTESDIGTLFATDYEVHFNSARTGVRLIGPKPQWARRDGGEAGLHPSNIHDNAYAIGAIDFTGDMPIILGPDGPSCGGFVCPATVALAELWKIGQLKPGDRVRFRPLTSAEAGKLLAIQDSEIETLQAGRRSPPVAAMAPDSVLEPAVLGRTGARPDIPEVVYRRSGDANLLVEYGPPVLDLALRLRVHALQSWLQRRPLPGIIDLTPGIRSLQLHFDPRLLPAARLIEVLREAERELPPVDDMEVESRIVHLPLSWEDESTLLAIRKYMQTVRPDAPWCPSNIEFIRRINGLDSVEEVRRIAFDASYLVLALGDVYLGAPVATPIDPRHRLVTTKYNPARTWTPENAVGIGGAYLCVYGMEGPGGYQFIGRTCQMWNRYRTTAEFSQGHPWLLRFFDQIRFYPVTHNELLKFRSDFLMGRVNLRIEPTTFRLHDYRQFLKENQASIDRFKAAQQQAFEAERQRWEEAGITAAPLEMEPGPAENPAALEPGCVGVPAHLPGNVWKVFAEPGGRVKEGEVLLIVESMKMEISIVASQAGRVREVRCAEGRPVQAGETVVVLENEES